MKLFKIKRSDNNKGDLYFMKKTSIFFMALLVMASMVGCGSGSTAKTSDLSGTWKQSNSKSDDSYQEAAISGDLIEIYWVSDGGDSKSLYWAGSYVPPTEAVDSYSWDSVNDHSKTDSSLLASGDDTKTFTYEKGEISYSASAMGTTTTVRLEKVEN